MVVVHAHESLLTLCVVLMCVGGGVGVANRFETNGVAHRSLLLIFACV